MKYIIIPFLLLSACGPILKTKKDPRTISGVNPTFTSYIAEYLSYKGHPLYYEIPIQFVDLYGNTVGLCTRWSSGERQIQIDPYYWDSMSENMRYQTIAHELGHCDLNRDHVNDMNNGLPVSIMYPFAFTPPYHYLPYYMNELFNPGVNTQENVMALKTNCVHDIEVE